MSRQFFCFGKMIEGHLEMRPKLMNTTQMDEDGPSAIAEIACTSEHTVMRTIDGRVWLYTEKTPQEFLPGENVESECVFVVKPIIFRMKITQIACGSKHCLALSNDGELFAWGSNSSGQLGVRLAVYQTWTDEPTRTACYGVVQIACGSLHSVALSQNGSVHCWGLNGNGQLGAISSSSSEHCVFLPILVDSLIGVPIIQVAAGGRHTVIVAASGAVFAWGENYYGQLGCGDNNDRHFPVQIKSLRSLKVCYVSCGDGHTTTLTKDGRLFTFGADTFGQLGHGKGKNANVPQQVIELMGSPVSWVACGRYFQRRVHSFGLGSNGQLGLGSINCNYTPKLVDQLDGAMVVFAGVNCTYCLVIHGHEPDLYSGVNFLLGVPKSLHLDEIKQLMGDKLTLLDHLEAVLSSSSCINLSFLFADDRRFNANKSNHGVDLDEVMETFDLLASGMDADRIDEVMHDTLQSTLLPELGPSPPDVEALRVFIILPFVSSFLRPSLYCRTLHIPFIRALLSLSQLASFVIECWWHTFQTRHFNRTVRVFKSALEHVISWPDADHRNQPNQVAISDQSFRDESTKSILTVLSMLNKVNNVKQKIPIESFYVDMLMDKRNIAVDYAHSVFDKSGDQWYWVDYPFIFNSFAKTTLLETDAAIQKQISLKQSNDHNIAAICTPSMVGPQVNPFLMLQVDRAYIVSNTIAQLMPLLQLDPNELKKPLKVCNVLCGVRRIIFAGEEADDVGGLTKEFFLLLFEALLDADYGMFLEDCESHLLWFTNSPFQDEHGFTLVGLLCGLAIYNCVVVDLHFPLALYKKLLGKTVDLEDLMQISPTEGKSLEQLLEYDSLDFENVFSLNFTITFTTFGLTTTVPLIDQGSDIPVTMDNREQFVDAYVDFRLNSGPDDLIKRHFNSFSLGFHRVLAPGRILNIFQPKELMELVVGNENYDWEAFKRNTKYQGVYWSGHMTIQLFWTVFFELPLEKRRKFLLFLTGSDRIPMQGMQKVIMIIQPSSRPQSMPVAHTCFNLLDLPMTKSKSVMKDKLLEAIEHTHGFGLV